MELWLALISLFLALIFLLLCPRLRSKEINLPPGPKGWPLVGNLFQLGPKPHATLANLACTHGPLFSIRLGTQRVVVASSSAAAALILKTHDQSLSARVIPQASRFPEYKNYTFIWSDCTHSWKKLRTICRSQLFSSKILDDGANLRQQKVEEMVRCLRSSDGKPTNISEAVFGTIFNMMAGFIFSKDAEGLVESTRKMKNLTRRIVELAIEPNVSDYFPVLAGLDLQGLYRQSRACFLKVYEVWEGIIVERKKQRERDGAVKRDDDFLDVLLSSGFSDLQIKALLLDMFVAGTDTATTAIEWAMAELMKQPAAMAKLREELSGSSGSTSTTDSALDQLPYLQACIKETLRLHPPAPFLPHRAAADCEVLGYTIPEGCLVWVNVWAIGRDPKSWVQPLTFWPQRFINSPNLDYKGADYELIPFGSGRRMCPGLPLATRFIESTLAALVHNFEWTLPQGMEPAQLDMEEKFGLTIQREQPLHLVPKFAGY